MKKTVFNLILAVAMLTGFTACDRGGSTAEEVRNLLARYQTAAKSADTAALDSIYPAAAKAEALFTDFSLDSLAFDATAGDTLTMKLAKDVEVTLMRSPEGKWQIAQSKGLFRYAPERFDLAKATGQYNPDLDDTDNAARMADSAFVAWYQAGIYDKAIAELKKQISVKTSESEMMANVTIVNNTDKELAGNAYAVRAKEMTSYMAGMTPVEEVMEVKTLTGKSVPAHGSASYSFHPAYAVTPHGGWTKASISFNLSKEDAAKNYQPTGTEYEDYLKAKK